MVKALVFLAEGFEEIEFTSIVDVLRRGGIEVVVAGIKEGATEGSHGIKILPDRSIDEVNVDDFDAVICPGGAPGYMNLRKDTRVIGMLQGACEQNKIVAAICASPAVLSDAGVLKDKNCTIYPGMDEELVKGGGSPTNQLVVSDGNILTSQGPATAISFALTLIERLVGKDKSEEVRSQVLANIALK